ncbi:CHAT domain-containing protein [Longimicrobium sp.]|uniref:CHAT domain-containing protein n=1 Tax=Longimicrobium sp. TaxID=2029185 RepID=UPI003B3A120C
MAQALGNALVRRGGDATLAAAAHAILARTGDPAATGKLAQAHVEYAAGQAAYYGVDYAAAGEHFARTLEIHAPSPSLESWARLFHASMLIATGKAAAAEPMLRALASQTDTLRGPALAGRSRWALATALLRSGRYEAALGSARDGARLLGRAGEHELQYAAQYVAADAEFYLGAMPAAHETAQRGLVALRRNHGSIWLLNTLSVAAKTAEADGLPLAAIRIQGERVMRAERLKIPVRVAEARLGRARLLADAGMLEQARTDVDASEPLVNGLPAGPSRTWLGADLRLARAAILRSNSPARASAALDSVLAISAGSLTAPRLLRAWVGRADARLAMGNVQGAEEDLNAASVLLARERDAIAVTEFRASLLNAARGVFDRLTMIRLAARDTAGALRYLERGRTSFGPTGRDSVGQEEGRWRMRPGEVAAAYAMVGDTLLVWTVAGTDLRLFRRTVNREELVGAIDELRSSLERGMDGESVRHALEALYERLVRPIESRLGDVNTTLVLIADGELAPVPFSALYDARHRRHLMETHPVRYAGSLRDAVRTRAHAPPDDLTALLVADPAFDARMQPDLLRLAGARAEVDSIAAAYPRHYVLSDSGAARGALTAALPGARVVHFAGHAVFDDQRPERSFLVLASERGGTGPARLTAAEMEEMPLQHVDLVVLSACETLRARNGRSDGFAGFAGALLDAGTGGVVGSLWRVDDRLTTPLMIEFHRAYRRSGDGPQALRDAQLQMLRSPDPALRSPAAWAGFRYAGN